MTIEKTPYYFLEHTYLLHLLTIQEIQNNILTCISPIEVRRKGTPIKIRLFVCSFKFHGVSTFVGYLMPNPISYK